MTTSKHQISKEEDILLEESIEIAGLEHAIETCWRQYVDIVSPEQAQRLLEGLIDKREGATTRTETQKWAAGKVRALARDVVLTLEPTNTDDLYDLADKIERGEDDKGYVEKSPSGPEALLSHH